MGGRPGSFHKEHGQNIRLLERGAVAERVVGFNDAVVFTQQPIPEGSMFQVKLLDKGGRWSGSIVSVRDTAKANVRSYQASCCYDLATCNNNIAIAIELP